MNKNHCRYFIGFPLPEKVDKHLSEVSLSLAEAAKLTPITDRTPLHITLVPPVERADLHSNIPEIMDDFCGQNFAPIVSIQEYAFFNSRVLYARCFDENGAPELTTQQHFREFVEKKYGGYADFFRFKRERKKFVPHVTLARAKTGAEFTRLNRHKSMLSSILSSHQVLLDKLALYVYDEDKQSYGVFYESSFSRVVDGGVYRHYKDRRKKYRVTGTEYDATHDRNLVRYVPLYKSRFESFVRTFPDFTGKVETPEGTVQRFELVKGR